MTFRSTFLSAAAPDIVPGFSFDFGTFAGLHTAVENGILMSCWVGCWRRLYNYLSGHRPRRVKWSADRYRCVARNASPRWRRMRRSDPEENPLIGCFQFGSELEPTSVSVTSPALLYIVEKYPLGVKLSGLKSGELSRMPLNMPIKVLTHRHAEKQNKNKGSL